MSSAAVAICALLRVTMDTAKGNYFPIYLHSPLEATKLAWILPVTDCMFDPFMSIRQTIPSSTKYTYLKQSRYAYVAVQIGI